MSSFGRAKTDASLRLYSLPRRELQALCKQYGIPTNKSNVGMADALSACVPIDYAKPKAWGVADSLRVSKTAPLKPKLDLTTGLPETSLASFTSNGKRKVSPVKLAAKRTVTKRDEASSLKSLQGGVKRFERPPNQMPHEEKTKATVVPAFTRGLYDRFGKAAAATSSNRPQVPTLRKRPGKVAESVTRSSGSLSTPKVSEPQIPKPVSGHKAESEIESEVSFTGIEFRNAALHKELFGVRSNIPEQEGEPGATSVAREAEFREDIVSESSMELGFEIRDMALHKELFGSHPKTNSMELQGSAGSPVHDLQGPGASANATDLVSSEPNGIFDSPTASTEVLDYSGHNIRVLSSIREEDASDSSDSKVDKLEHSQPHQLRQGRDLGPLLDGMSCGAPACSLSRMQEETNLALEQARSIVISPRRSMPLTTNIHNSPLVNSATPLSKIRSNIDCTLTKAASILEKLTALRADAEKKRMEGYWEPVFSAVPENVSPAAVLKTAFVADRELPSAKKARLTPQAILSLEKRLSVCEDADIVSRGEIPRAKRIRIPDGSRDLASVVSDKENQNGTSKEDQNSIARKLGGFGKDKGKEIDVLKDCSNTPDRVDNNMSEPRTSKSGIGEVRPEEMSLRKLRAQLKEKVSG